MKLFIRLCDEQQVPLADRSLSPIFYLRCRTMEKTFSMIKGLRQTHGIYASPAFFPAVPHGQAGARMTISLHNTEADIAKLVDGLAAEANRLELDRSSGTRLQRAETVDSEANASSEVA